VIHLSSIINSEIKEKLMKENNAKLKTNKQSAAPASQPVIMDLFYRKEGVPGTRIFTGEITAKYVTPSGIPMIELTQIDPETGDWRVFKIREENVKHMQPTRMA